MNAPTDFGKQLTRQLGFLERSCRSYDEGHPDEAIRIATVIRVLVHETRNQRPLLRHLDAMDILLVSTCSGASERAVIYTGLGQMRFSSEGVEWSANTSASAIERRVMVSDWWRQCIYVQGTVRLTRKDLVLAADKDGGAHVDANLTTEYESLMNADGKGFWNVPDPEEPGKFTPIVDAHLVFLRQMGFELLNSSELLALCRF